MNLTDKEIVKCAEKCIEDIPHCGVCPFDKDSIATSECMGEVIKNLLNIINRLQDEREALINGQETLQKTIVEQRAENKEIWEERNRIYESLKEEKAEIERLQKIIVGFMGEIGTWSNKYDVDISNILRLPLLAKEDWNIRNKIKSEAIREFADRLKSEVAHIPAWGAVAEKKIDNLVKEMTESVNYGSSKIDQGVKE